MDDLWRIVIPKEIRRNLRIREGDPLEQTMAERKTLQAFRGDDKVIPILSGEEGDYACQVVVPIISEGEIIGSVVLVDCESGSTMGEAELKAAQKVANFIGRQMEG